MLRFLILAAISISGLCYASPRLNGHCPAPGPHCRLPAHRPPPHHHDFWGPGGRYFWPGFIGGVVGGAVANTVVEREIVVVQPAPVVVTQPAAVVVQQPVVMQQSVAQNVWVEGRYVDQVQANGTIVRVWQPGHYEQRAVTVR